MSTNRVAIVDSSGNVVNVTLVDSGAMWVPGPGLTAHTIPADSPVGPGWTWAGGNTYNPPPTPEPVDPTPEPPTTPELQEQIDALMLDSLDSQAAIVERLDQQDELIDALILESLG